MLFSYVCEEKVTDGQAMRIDHDDFCEVLEKIRLGSRAAAAEWLTDMWVAGIATGLRPAEWPLAYVDRQDGRTNLHIISVHNQEIWTHRTLIITDLPSATLDSIERTVEQARTWLLKGDFPARQGEVSRVLAHVCQSFFKKKLHFDLATLRFQFISNMKAVHTPDVAAALIGHISKVEAAHYVNHRAAWPVREIVERPAAVAEQAARMRTRIRYRDERAQFWTPIH